MKKAFKKYDLFKIVGIVMILAVLLTWIFKQSSFNGTELVVSEITRMGLNDIFTYGLLSLYYFSIVATFLLIIGGFYQVLSKTSGYQTLVDKLAKIFKGKEIVFVLILSFLFGAITSISNEIYQMFIFVPFFVTVALRMKLDKITALCSTIGGILIGILGATYSPVVLEYIHYYLGTTWGNGILVQIIIFFATYILFNLFTIMRVVKIKALGKKEIEEEAKDDKFAIKEVNKGKVWPLLVVLGAVFIFQTLGYIEWTEALKVEFFNNYHTMVTGSVLGTIVFKVLLVALILGLIQLVRYIIFRVQNKKKFKWQIWIWLLSAFGVILVLDICNVAGWFNFYNIGFIKTILTTFNELTIGEFALGSIPVAQYVLGTSGAFGGWDLYTIQMIILIATGIIAVIYKVGFDELLKSFAEGAKKMLKPILIILMIYAICIFSVVFPVIPTISSWFMGLCDKFSVFFASLSALIASVFNVEMRYVATSLLAYFGTTFAGTEPSLIGLIFQTMYGFVQFIAPTSVILMLGLSYLDISYKDWFKYIWLFIVVLLLILTGIICFAAFV